MYKITLSNGIVLNNIDVNGTTLISTIPISDTTFEHNLSPVDIELIGERSPIDFSSLEGHHENMNYVLIENSPEGEYWFGLYDIPESELQQLKTRSDIEYIALMMDIEL